VLKRALRELSALPPGAALSERLITGSSNSGWSIGVELLQGLVSAAYSSDGPILDCGSGLSTLVLASIAQRTGRQVWALEHDPAWAERVRVALGRERLSCVTLCVAPLRSFGAYARTARRFRLGDVRRSAGRYTRRALRPVAADGRTAARRLRGVVTPRTA
jgi:hypothetical protein